MSFLKFATLGITTEIIFTASYVWMIPIYGSIAFLIRQLCPPG
jgi:hypothetical protein